MIAIAYKSQGLSFNAYCFANTPLGAQQHSNSLTLKAETLTETALKKWNEITPWSDEKAAPPEQKSFELLRLYSDKQHYNSPTEPLKKSPNLLYY